MFVLIGLPVLERAWILPTWFDAIAGQTWPLDQVGFIFEVAPDDTQTTGTLFEWHGRHPEVRCFEVATSDLDHQIHPPNGRKWNRDRYAVMAELRNRLLDRAMCYQPDRYFSLDSDIILQDPTTISELVKLTEAFDAVAPLTFMTPEDVEFPNVMSWIGKPGDRAIRATPYPLGTFFRADVIMGAVMMNEHGFTQSRYRSHPQGEDLGWAASCYEAGLQLWSASYLYASHVMHQRMLEPYLQDGDLRVVPDLRCIEATAAGAVVVGSTNP